MHKVRKYPGPLKGEDLNEHIKSLMVVGALVNFQGMGRPLVYPELSPYIHAEEYDQDRFLFLERVEQSNDFYKAAWWKLLSLKQNTIRYSPEADIRRYMTARYQDSYFNKWLKSRGKRK